MWTGGAGPEPLKKEVERPGEKAPQEFPLARRDGIGFREEVHQGKKQPDCRAGDAQATTARSTDDVSRSATPEVIPECLR